MKKILLLAGLILLSGLVYFAYNRKKAQDLSNIERIFKLEESAVFKWEIHYDNVHLICWKKEPLANREPSAGKRLLAPKKIHYLLIDKKSFNKKGDFNANSPTTDKSYLVAPSTFLANVKNFNTLDYVSIIGNTNEETKWGIKRNQFYKIFYRDKKGKKQLKTLYRGNQTIAPKGYYVAASDSDKVYSVEEWVVKALEKKLEDLRDKDFLKVRSEEISHIVIGDWLDVKKLEKHWSVNGRQSNKIHIQHVDKLINDISFLKAKKVFATNIFFNDLREKITITYKNKKARSNKTFSFYLGKEAEKYYSKIPDQNETYELTSVSLSIITNPLSYYLNQCSNSQ